MKRLFSSSSIVRVQELLSLRPKERFAIPQTSSSSSSAFESFEEIPSADADRTASVLTRLRALNFQQPTPLQARLLHHFFTARGADLLVKGEPGSGKSIGYLIALAALSSLGIGSSIGSSSSIGSNSNNYNNNTQNIRHLVLVPTEQLAAQLRDFVSALLLPTADVVSSRHSPSASSASVAQSAPLTRSIPSAHSTHATPSTSSIHSIPSAHSIHSTHSILITQPDALSVKLAQGEFDWRSLETVVLDEADALIKPLKRHATAAQKRNRAHHPVPAVQLLRQLWSLFRGDPLRKDLRPRLVVCSATLNKGTRHDLTAAGILLEGGRSCISINLSIPNKESRSQKEQEQKQPSSPLSQPCRYYKHLLLSDPDSVDELIAKLSAPLNQLLQEQGGGAVAMILLPAAQSKVGLISLLRQHFPDLRFGLLSDGWREGVDVFVGSDVDVRGLNIPGLQHVIILDLPRSPAHFTHMAGRVGRSFNPQGTVWTVLGTAKDYEKYTTMMAQLGHLSLPA